MDRFEFRRILDDEVEKAYSIICARTDWLNSKGIKQWTEPLPRNVFDDRQRNGDNYGLFKGNDICAIISIVKTCVPWWADETNNEPKWWFETLATRIEFAGMRLGEETIKRAIGQMRSTGSDCVYADCVKGDGFLQQYYEELGFITILEKEIEFPKCGLLKMILMKSDLRAS